MSLLKKENWWIWILLWLFTNGYSNIILGVLLGVLDKKAWYAKWYLWIIGLILIFPIIIMFIIFNIEVTMFYGEDIEKVSEQVINTVKNSIEKYASIYIDFVNLTVKSLTIKKQNL